MSTYLHMCPCDFGVRVCMCVMYRLWKMTAGVQSRCQVAAGNLKGSHSWGRGVVSKPDLQNQCPHKRAKQHHKVEKPTV